MKKWWKKLFILFSVGLILTMSSCKMDYVCNYMSDVRPWKNQKKLYSSKLEVALTVTEDIDYLYWTKSNGELLYTDKNYRFMPYFHSNEKLSFEARKEPYVFDFTNVGSGKYMLNIHYKDTAKNSDNDYQGFVFVTESVAIWDKYYDEYCGYSCRKMGKATLQNDSSIVAKNLLGRNTGGNVINEYYYAEFDRNKGTKNNFFKIVYKINNISLRPGEQTVILLPIPPAGTSISESGLIAFPIISGGKVFYYGKTLKGIGKNGFSHPMDGSINFDVVPIGNGMFSCYWD